MNNFEVREVKRKTSVIPFGYKLKEGDPKTLVSIPLELRALEKAKEYLLTGDYSNRHISEWLQSVTGRYLSNVALHKIMRGKLDRAIDRLGQPPTPYTEEASNEQGTGCQESSTVRKEE